MKVLACFAFTALVGCAGDEHASTPSALTQEPGNCGATETHVIGIYSAPGGKATLRIERPGNHAIVVSAHEATTWTIETAPGATIAGVYAVGVHEQKVNVAQGTKVVRDWQDAGGPYACGYTFPGEGNGCNTQNLLDLSEKVVRHTATSFHGCYAASQWTIGEDLTTLSNCDERSGDYQNDMVQGCNGADSCGGPVFY